MFEYFFTLVLFGFFVGFCTFLASILGMLMFIPMIHETKFHKCLGWLFVAMILAAVPAGLICGVTCPTFKEAMSWTGIIVCAVTFLGACICAPKVKTSRY